MDAGVIDLWWFGTACELLFAKCVSSVSHGHRLARLRKSNRLRRSRKCALAPSSATTSANLRTSDLGERIILSRCGLCQRRLRDMRPLKRSP
jgi:hypothetical protein